MDELIRNLAVYAIPILFAITMHDAAQAWVAKYFGDNTAHAAGRTSFNPLSHIDPLGTIVMPVVLFLMKLPVFGWARPLPLNYGQMRNPKRDMAWVALSGPVANFLMAFLWFIFGIFLQYFQVQEAFPNRVAEAGIITNLWLMAFNLLPIPSMDGGRVVFSLLPQRAAYNFARLEPYGFMILLALILLKVVTVWLILVQQYAWLALNILALPLKLLLS